MNEDPHQQQHVRSAYDYKKMSKTKIIDWVSGNGQPRNQWQQTLGILVVDHKDQCYN